MQIQSLFIKEYQQLCDFKMYFMSQNSNSSSSSKDKENSFVNINLLVGPNGSGKSTLIDALYSLTAKTLDAQSVPFEYTLKWGHGEKIVGEKVVKAENSDGLNKLPWKRVVRLFTGMTERNAFELGLESKVFEQACSLSGKDCNYALFTTFLYHAYQSDKSDEVWNKVNQLLWENPTRPKTSIEPQILWLELSVEDGLADAAIEELKRLKIHATIQRQTQNGLRLFWSVKKIKGSEVSNQAIDFNPWQVFIKILQLVNQGAITDTGFLFYRNSETGLIRSESLSDGELGFYSRFALIYLLRFLPTVGIQNPQQDSNSRQRCLVLLDEPEVHFNEYWKSELIYHICDCLKKSTHFGFDVFISTHSAMLVSDAKPEEIHRLQQHNSGIMAYPPPINTFGANPIDIGRSLFMMESDIGKRSKKEIENILNEKITVENAGDIAKNLRNLMNVVGPGEWRWRIRNQLREAERLQNSSE